MTDNFQSNVLNKSTWIKLFILTLFLFQSGALQANKQIEKPTQFTMDRDTAKSSISRFKANKLDYLQNKKQLKKIFEVSKEQNWETLHLEAAALYAELLFRDEQYDALNTHVNKYLAMEAIQARWDLYLLLLEAKLKYLSQQEEQTPAKTLVKKLEAWLPDRTINEKIIIYRALAYYYTSSDSLSKTLDVSLEGLDLSIEQADNASQGFFLRKIGDAYNYLNEKDKAVDYAKKAIVAYENTQDHLLTAKAYWSLGNALLDVGNSKDAIGYFKKALLYFKSVNMQKGVTFAQYSIASIQYEQGNYKDALSTVNQNIALATTAGVFDMQLASMILLSDIYEKQNLYKKANDTNDLVFLSLDKFSRSIYKSDFLGKRYKLKRHLGYDKDAFEAIEQELFYTKKHLEATSENHIRSLQVKYEVKKKEEEILRLAHQNDISAFKAKEEYQQKLIWRLSTAIAFILVLASLWLFYRQVTQRKKYHALASTDFLTKCPNRRGIMQLAENIIKEQATTIAIVDLDYFKKINDSFGHDIGDLVLIAFANAAKQSLKGNGEFGRYGGEEWLFILNTTDVSTINTIFSDLNKNLSKYCAEISSKNTSFNEPVTFSVGATISHSTQNQLDDLIKNADKLLYQAKENGRNQVIIN